MSRSLVRSFASADERRAFAGGVLDLISIGRLTFGKETLKPGWRWSKDVRPIVGTDRCEVHDVGYQVSGRWICEDLVTSITHALTLDAGLAYEERGSVQLKGVPGTHVLYAVALRGPTTADAGAR
jgi:hypothetical protein